MTDYPPPPEPKAEPYIMNGPDYINFLVPQIRQLSSGWWEARVLVRDTGETRTVVSYFDEFGNAYCLFKSRRRAARKAHRLAKRMWKEKVVAIKATENKDWTDV